jgi:hypothetical protein
MLRANSPECGFGFPGTGIRHELRRVPHDGPHIPGLPLHCDTPWKRKQQVRHLPRLMPLVETSQGGFVRLCGELRLADEQVEALNRHHPSVV